MAQLWGYIKPADRPAGKKQKEWYPLRCTYDADGRAVLQVDTELTLNSATLNIDNFFVASDDGTATGAKYIKVKADGTIFVEGTFTISVGAPKHYNGNANIISALVTFDATTKSILIQNMHNVNEILVSFDNEVNWKTIRKSDSISFEGAIASLKIKADADGTPYEILTTE